MQLTIRTKDDFYIDLDVNIANRTVVFMSPIPNISTKQLMKLADDFHWTLILPITGEKIIPDDLKPSDKEIETYYTVTTTEALANILSVCNLIVSEN